MNSKFWVYLSVFIYSVIQNQGLVQILDTNEGDVLMKILQLVNEVSSDERLFDVTVKVLRSLCACMRDTLKSNEKAFSDGSNLLENDTRKAKLYEDIYNRTCLNLTSKPANDLKTTHGVQGNEYYLTNQLEEVSELPQTSQSISENNKAIDNKIHVFSILYKILIETRNFHQYNLRKYSVLKRFPITKNEGRDSIVIITLYPKLNENANWYNDDTIITETELNNTLYSKSSVDIDVIDNFFERFNNKLTKSEPVMLCVLQSVYMFIVNKWKENKIKILKILRKKKTIKLYINILVENYYEDYTQLCCNKSFSGACEINSPKIVITNISKQNNEKSEKIVPNQNVEEDYVKTISKIRKIFNIFDNIPEERSQYKTSNGIHDNTGQDFSCSNPLGLCLKNVIEKNELHTEITTKLTDIIKNKSLQDLKEDSTKSSLNISSSSKVLPHRLGVSTTVENLRPSNKINISAKNSTNHSLQSLMGANVTISENVIDSVNNTIPDKSRHTDSQNYTLEIRVNKIPDEVNKTRNVTMTHSGIHNSVYTKNHNLEFSSISLWSKTNKSSAISIKTSTESGFYNKILRTKTTDIVLENTSKQTNINISIELQKHSSKSHKKASNISSFDIEIHHDIINKNNSNHILDSLNITSGMNIRNETDPYNLNRVESAPNYTRDKTGIISSTQLPKNERKQKGRESVGIISSTGNDDVFPIKIFSTTRNHYFHKVNSINNELDLINTVPSVFELNLNDLTEKSLKKTTNSIPSNTSQEYDRKKVTEWSPNTNKLNRTTYFSSGNTYSSVRFPGLLQRSETRKVTLQSTKSLYSTFKNNIINASMYIPVHYIKNYREYEENKINTYNMPILLTTMLSRDAKHSTLTTVTENMPSNTFDASTSTSTYENGTQVQWIHDKLKLSDFGINSSLFHNDPIHRSTESKYNVVKFSQNVNNNYSTIQMQHFPNTTSGKIVEEEIGLQTTRNTDIEASVTPKNKEKIHQITINNPENEKINKKYYVSSTTTKNSSVISVPAKNFIKRTTTIPINIYSNYFSGLHFSTFDYSFHGSDTNVMKNSSVIATGKNRLESLNKAGIFIASTGTRLLPKNVIEPKNLSLKLNSYSSSFRDDMINITKSKINLDQHLNINTPLLMNTVADSPIKEEFVRQNKTILRTTANIVHEKKITSSMQQKSVKKNVETKNNSLEQVNFPTTLNAHYFYPNIENQNSVIIATIPHEDNFREYLLEKATHANMQNAANQTINLPTATTNSAVKQTKFKKYFSDPGKYSSTYYDDMFHKTMNKLNGDIKVYTDFSRPFSNISDTTVRKEMDRKFKVVPEREDNKQRSKIGTRLEMTSQIPFTTIANGVVPSWYTDNQLKHTTVTNNLELNTLPVTSILSVNDPGYYTINITTNILPMNSLSKPVEKEYSKWKSTVKKEVMKVNLRTAKQEMEWTPTKTKQVMEWTPTTREQAIKINSTTAMTATKTTKGHLIKTIPTSATSFGKGVTSSSPPTKIIKPITNYSLYNYTSVTSREKYFYTTLEDEQNSKTAKDHKTDHAINNTIVDVTSINSERYALSEVRSLRPMTKKTKHYQFEKIKRYPFATIANVVVSSWKTDIELKPKTVTSNYLELDTLPIPSALGAQDIAYYATNITTYISPRNKVSKPVTKEFFKWKSSATKQVMKGKLNGTRQVRKWNPTTTKQVIKWEPSAAKQGIKLKSTTVMTSAEITKELLTKTIQSLSTSSEKGIKSSSVIPIKIAKPTNLTNNSSHNYVSVTSTTEYSYPTHISNRVIENDKNCKDTSHHILYSYNGLLKNKQNSKTAINPNHAINSTIADLSSTNSERYASSVVRSVLPNTNKTKDYIFERTKWFPFTTIANDVVSLWQTDIELKPTTVTNDYLEQNTLRVMSVPSVYDLATNSTTNISPVNTLSKPARTGYFKWESSVTKQERKWKPTSTKQEVQWKPSTIKQVIKWEPSAAKQGIKLKSTTAMAATETIQSLSTSIARGFKPLSPSKKIIKHTTLTNNLSPNDTSVTSEGEYSYPTHISNRVIENYKNHKAASYHIFYSYNTTSGLLKNEKNSKTAINRKTDHAINNTKADVTYKNSERYTSSVVHLVRTQKKLDMNRIITPPAIRHDYTAREFVTKTKIQHNASTESIKSNITLYKDLNKIREQSSENILYLMNTYPEKVISPHASNVRDLGMKTMKFSIPGPNEKNKTKMAFFLTSDRNIHMKSSPGKAKYQINSRIRNNTSTSHYHDNHFNFLKHQTAVETATDNIYPGKTHISSIVMNSSLVTSYLAEKEVKQMALKKYSFERGMSHKSTYDLSSKGLALNELNNTTPISPELSHKQYSAINTIERIPTFAIETMSKLHNIQTGKKIPTTISSSILKKAPKNIVGQKKKYFSSSKPASYSSVNDKAIQTKKYEHDNVKLNKECAGNCILNLLKTGSDKVFVHETGWQHTNVINNTTPKTVTDTNIIFTSKGNSTVLSWLPENIENYTRSKTKSSDFQNSFSILVNQSFNASETTPIYSDYMKHFTKQNTSNYIFDYLNTVSKMSTKKESKQNLRTVVSSTTDNKEVLNMSSMIFHTSMVPFRLADKIMKYTKTEKLNYLKSLHDSDIISDYTTMRTVLSSPINQKYGQNSEYLKLETKYYLENDTTPADTFYKSDLKKINITTAHYKDYATANVTEHKFKTSRIISDVNTKSSVNIVSLPENMINPKTNQNFNIFSHKNAIMESIETFAKNNIRNITTKIQNESNDNLKYYLFAPYPELKSSKVHVRLNKKQKTIKSTTDNHKIKIKTSFDNTIDVTKKTIPEDTVYIKSRSTSIPKLYLENTLNLMTPSISTEATFYNRPSTIYNVSHHKIPLEENIKHYTISEKTASNNTAFITEKYTSNVAKPKNLKIITAETTTIPKKLNTNLTVYNTFYNNTNNSTTKFMNNINNLEDDGKFKKSELKTRSRCESKSYGVKYTKILETLQSINNSDTKVINNYNSTTDCVTSAYINIETKNTTVTKNKTTPINYSTDIRSSLKVNERILKFSIYDYTTTNSQKEDFTIKNKSTVRDRDFTDINNIEEYKTNFDIINKPKIPTTLKKGKSKSTVITSARNNPNISLFPKSKGIPKHIYSTEPNSYDIIFIHSNIPKNKTKTRTNTHRIENDRITKENQVTFSYTIRSKSTNIKNDKVIKYNTYMPTEFDLEMPLKWSPNIILAKTKKNIKILNKLYYFTRVPSIIYSHSTKRNVVRKTKRTTRLHTSSTTLRNQRKMLKNTLRYKESMIRVPNVINYHSNISHFTSKLPTTDPLVSTTTLRSQSKIPKSILQVKNLHRNLRTKDNKTEYLIDQFEKTKLYPIKSIPLHAQRKISKIIQIGNHREISGLDSHNFHLQRPFTTQKYIYKDVPIKQQTLRYDFHVKPNSKIFFNNLAIKKNSENRQSKEYFRPKPLLLSNDDYYREGFTGHHKSGFSWRDKVNFVRQNLPPMAEEAEISETIERPVTSQNLSTKPKFLRDRINSIRNYINTMEDLTERKDPGQRSFFRRIDDSDLIESQENPELHWHGWVNMDTTSPTPATTTRRKRRLPITLFFLSPTTAPYRRYF